MKPLKLDDTAVREMVRALIEYECRTEAGAFEDGVLSLAALRPLVDRYRRLRDEERHVFRDAFEANRLRIVALGTLDSEQAKILRREMDVAAGSLALSFGHAALRQGHSFECPRCGMSGSAHAAPSGALFDTPCTLPLGHRTQRRITDAAQRFGLTEATLAHGEEMLRGTQLRDLMAVQGFPAIDHDKDGTVKRHIEREGERLNLAWVSPPCEHYSREPLAPQPPCIHRNSIVVDPDGAGDCFRFCNDCGENFTRGAQ